MKSKKPTMKKADFSVLTRFTMNNLIRFLEYESGKIKNIARKTKKKERDFLPSSVIGLFRLWLWLFQRAP